MYGRSILNHDEPSHDDLPSNDVAPLHDKQPNDLALLQCHCKMTNLCPAAVCKQTGQGSWVTSLMKNGLFAEVIIFAFFSVHTAKNLSSYNEMY